MTLEDLLDIAHDRDGFRLFFDCYRAAQNGAPLAHQDALPMRQLAKIMSHLTLLEQESPEQLIYRIAGDTVIERLQFNPTGTNFLDLLPSDQRDEAVAGHQTMLTHPCGFYMVYESEFENGSRAIIETITLPLRKTAGAEPKLFLSYHAHHSTTGIAEINSGTVLAINRLKTEYADIGCGEPDEKLLNSSSNTATAAA